MDQTRKKHLLQSYADRPKPAGVFQITNTVNGKMLLGSSLNLDGRLNRHRFMLSAKAHDNAALQKDWLEYGAEAFTFEVLELVSVTEEPSFDTNDALRALEDQWSAKVNPFDGRGYNTKRDLRDV